MTLESTGLVLGIVATVLVLVGVVIRLATERANALRDIRCLKRRVRKLTNGERCPDCGQLMENCRCEAGD